MTIPYPVDPSLPSNPSPLFSDSTAARGDHLRSNNRQIWANILYAVETILGNASLSTDETFSALSDLLFPSQKAVAGYVNNLIDSLFPIGTSWEYSGMAANIPSVCMIETGASLLRADYTDCFSALSAVIGAVTITIATPGVVTSDSHPFQTGDCVHLTTSGALPTGLSANTNYYVIVNGVNDFWLATTFANALAGIKIATSGTQSGTHTLTWIPWGAADGTHFYLPDTQGLITEGSGQLTTNGAAWGGVNYKGRLGQYKQDLMQGHRFLTNNIPNIAAIGASAIGENGYLFDGVFTSHSNFAYTITTDGTNGTPRTGAITNAPRVGKWKIIRVI